MTFDLIVIGGGPSGMMAAGRAAELGARVLLLEKNESLGKKLLITGGGRCNVTNAESDLRTLLEKYQDASRFLFSPFSQWNNIDARNFFESRSMPTKVENEGRVFPASDSAQSVWNVLKRYVDFGHVEIMYAAQVKEILAENDSVTGVLLKNGTLLHANKVILATGGKSRPETGSTGDGFVMAGRLGHAVVQPVASLVPVVVRDAWVKALMGKSIDSVRISVMQDGKKQISKTGKILFTHFGITGPTVLNMSKDIGEYLSYGPVEIALDLFPGIDLGTLNKNLTELFKTHSNKHIKNTLSGLVTNGLVEQILHSTQIDGDTPCHSVTREERIRIIDTVKNLSMRATGLMGTDKAIVTSGGIPLSEVDTKTMESRIVQGLYLVGDMLDIDRPSGGYSLQLCWTTGYVAGSAAAEK